MMRFLRNVRILLMRELYGYFCTPIAYIFLVIFLVLTGIFTFGDNLGNFYGRGIADLSTSFFVWHPWLFMMFVPAVGMRLWSEELEHGTLELLTTLPATLWHAVVAKFLAGCVILALALLMTFPVIITVNYLGEPDNGKIMCGYLGSFLMAAAFLSVGSFTSACTRNQVVSFIVSLVVAMLLILCGFPPIVNMLRQIMPEFLAQVITNWSIYSHFEGMQRGMIDTSDVVYFMGLIGFGLIATLVSLKKMLWRWLKVVALAVVFLAIISIGSHHRSRLDLTADSRHTLSAGSRRIVQRITSPVTLSFYFSRGEKSVPQPIKDFARRVEALLNQFERAGRGKVLVRYLDAKPDSPMEDTMIHLGIEPRELTDRERRFFIGIEVARAGTSIVMPVLEIDKERNLEFELSRAIQRVVNEKRKVVGMIAGLPVLGRSLSDNPYGMRARLKPWIFIRELSKDYEIRELSMTATALPDDLDLLVLFHPNSLSEGTKYLVDQFVLRGGNLIALLDPLCSVSLKNKRYRVPDPRKHGSTLEPLLSAWGVVFDPNAVVVDPGYSVEKKTGEQPAFLDLDSAAMGRGDVVSATLKKLRLPYCGHFVVHSSPDVTVTPLVSSSESARVLSSTDVVNSRDLNPLIQNAPPGVRVLAVKLNGFFTSAYPDGTPVDGVQLGVEPLSKSRASGTVILIGDVDFLEDRIWTQRYFNQYTKRETRDVTHDNNNLFQNAVEQLAGGADLIAVRTRSDLPEFTRVNRMWHDADEKLRAELIAYRHEAETIAATLKKMRAERRNRSRFMEDPEERRERERLRKKQIEVSERLKTLHRDRRSSIDRLGVILLWLNVGLTPLLVALTGVGVAVWRRMR